MRLTLRTILLLIAVVLFVLAAVGVALGSLAVVPLGLASFAGAFVVPDTIVGARRYSQASDNRFELSGHTGYRSS